MTDTTPLRPLVSVATIVEREGRLLMVEERIRGALRLNQPAGHLEGDETPAQGAIRETLEESAWHVDIAHLISIYQWRPDDSRRSYLRFTFAATARAHDATRRLDAGIVRALWMTVDEIRACASRHRTPLVMRCVDYYLAGRRMPLDCIATLGDLA